MATYITVEGGVSGNAALLQRNKVDTETNRLRRIEGEKDAAVESKATTAKRAQLAEGNPQDRPSDGGGGTTPPSDGGGTTPGDGDARRPGGAFHRRNPVVGKPGAYIRRTKSIYLFPTQLDTTSISAPYFEETLDDPSSDPPYNLAFNGYNQLKQNKAVPFVATDYSVSGPWGNSRFDAQLEPGGGVRVAAQINGSIDNGAARGYFIALAPRDEPGKTDTAIEDFSIELGGQYTVELLLESAYAELEIFTVPYIFRFDYRGLWLVGNIFNDDFNYELTGASVGGLTHFALSASPTAGCRVYVGGEHIITVPYQPAEPEYYGPKDVAGFYRVTGGALQESGSYMLLKRARITPRMLYKGQTAVPKWR